LHFKGDGSVQAKAYVRVVSELHNQCSELLIVGESHLLVFAPAVSKEFIERVAEKFGEDFAVKLSPEGLATGIENESPKSETIPTGSSGARS